MAYFTSKNGKWQAQITVNGKRKSKILKTKREAKDWAYEQEKLLGNTRDIANKHTLAEAIDRYNVEVAPTHKGAKQDILRLNKFKKYPIVQKNITEITSYDIEDLRDARLEAVSADSVLREFSTLRSCFQYARKKWRWCNDNPFVDVWFPKKSPPRVRRISEEEITLILKGLYFDENNIIQYTSRHEVAIVFLLALETGMRQGELRGGAHS